jgi:hypothetical protein
MFHSFVNKQIQTKMCSASKRNISRVEEEELKTSHFKKYKFVGTNISTVLDIFFYTFNVICNHFRRV